MDEHPGFVVVVFGGSAAGYCSLDRCPAAVYWAPNLEAAGWIAAQLPAGMEPHVLSVTALPGSLTP